MDSDDEDTRKVEEPLPPYRIRYSDLELKLVKTVIRGRF
jgi:hypothetical protein